jgi:transposase
VEGAPSGVEAKGAAIVARSVRRGQLLKFFASLSSCLIGMAACGSARRRKSPRLGAGRRCRVIAAK